MDGLMETLKTLIALTEEKIEAVTTRDSARLLELLQQEIDPIATLDHFADELEGLSSDEKDAIRRLLSHWQTRSQYLTDILNQHLGYIDFVRSMMTGSPRSGLDMGL